MIKVMIYATLPDTKALNELLRVIRKYDVAHQGCHFGIVAMAPDATTSEMLDALKVSPPFPFKRVEPNAKKS